MQVETFDCRDVAQTATFALNVPAPRERITIRPVAPSASSGDSQRASFVILRPLMQGSFYTSPPFLILKGCGGLYSYAVCGLSELLVGGATRVEKSGGGDVQEIANRTEVTPGLT